MACMKRSFSNSSDARRAHRRASWRIRTYWCEECRALHVTNDEKR